MTFWFDVLILASFNDKAAVHVAIMHGSFSASRYLFLISILPIFTPLQISINTRFYLLTH